MKHTTRSMRHRVGEAPPKGKGDPDPEKKDGEDEDDDDGKADLAGCASSFRSAAELCTTAAASYTSAADGLDKGIDSVSSLTAAEQASMSAREACEDAEAASMGLRGATLPETTPPPSSPKPGATPPAPGARAIARAAGGSASAALEVTALVALGRFAMAQVGEPDPVRARGKLAARLQIADRAEHSEKDAAGARAESATVRRERLWEQAVTDGRFRAGQVFAQAEGPPDEKGQPTRVRVFSAYAAKMNAAHPENDGLESFLGAFPRLERGSSEQASDVLTVAGDQRRGMATLTEADKASAQRAGVAPDLLARALAAKGHTPDEHQRA